MCFNLGSGFLKLVNTSEGLIFNCGESSSNENNVSFRRSRNNFRRCRKSIFLNCHFVPFTFDQILYSKSCSKGVSSFWTLWYIANLEQVFEILFLIAIGLDFLRKSDPAARETYLKTAGEMGRQVRTVHNGRKNNIIIFDTTLAKKREQRVKLTPYKNRSIYLHASLSKQYVYICEPKKLRAEKQTENTD